MMQQRILIVEDDEINCFIYRAIFKNEGYALDFAYNGQQGVDKFGQNEYNLILLDLGLPLIDGITVAKIIREQEKNNLDKQRTPVIAVTADNSTSSRIRAFEAGVDEYVNKPFDVNSLKDLVTKYLNLESAPDFSFVPPAGV